jgi:putative transposase
MYPRGTVDPQPGARPADVWSMRKPRQFEPGMPQHIWVRGNNRRRIFTEERDFLRFTRYLGDAVDKTGCLIHAVTLMTNHLHLVMTPPDAEQMAICMRRALQPYALVRNKLRDCSGKLFEGAYGSHMLASDEQLAVTLQYVEMNPVRAGMVRQPEKYYWTTYRLHSGYVSHPFARFWSPHEWYWRLGDGEERITHYQRCMAAYHAQKRLPDHGDPTLGGHPKPASDGHLKTGQS